MAEVFWEVMEKRLAALLSVMPGINPANLGDEPQQFLASYMPPGSWGEEEKALLRQFAEMDSRAFQNIYAGYRNKMQRQAFKRR